MPNPLGTGPEANKGIMETLGLEPNPGPTRHEGDPPPLKPISPPPFPYPEDGPVTGAANGDPTITPASIGFPYEGPDGQTIVGMSVEDLHRAIRGASNWPAPAAPRAIGSQRSGWDRARAVVREARKRMVTNGERRNYIKINDLNPEERVLLDRVKSWRKENGPLKEGTRYIKENTQENLMRWKIEHAVRRDIQHPFYNKIEENYFVLDATRRERNDLFELIRYRGNNGAYRVNPRVVFALENDGTIIAGQYNGVGTILEVKIHTNGSREVTISYLRLDQADDPNIIEARDLPETAIVVLNELMKAIPKEDRSIGSQTPSTMSEHQRNSNPGGLTGWVSTDGGQSDEDISKQPTVPLPPVAPQPDSGIPASPPSSDGVHDGASGASTPLSGVSGMSTGPLAQSGPRQPVDSGWLR